MEKDIGYKLIKSINLCFIYIQFFHFHVNDCLRIRLDPVIVPSDLLRHDVVSLPVPEFIDDGYFFVILLFPADFFVVYDDFGVEYLLFYFLSEVVRYGTNECSL